MKHIRITVRPERDRAPSFLTYLLDSPDVTDARAVDWNRGDAEISTHLYAIRGDATTVAELATETVGVESVTHAGTAGRVSYVVIALRDDDVPVFGGAAGAIDRRELLVRRPLVYREGRIEGSIIGEPAVLQATIDETPPTVTVQIDEIRQFPGPDLNPTAKLSDRQREALAVALELGYYETPRAATHEDVAAALDCAPNTASEHLQKGEAKLVRAGMQALVGRL
jgi:predicted DNA binding protein